MSLRWLLPQANPDVIRFTVTPTASAKTVTLENLTAPCNCFIDWGDGERSAQIVSATSERELISSTDVTSVLPTLIAAEFQNPPSTP